MEPHRARLGDLLDLVEIAGGAIADANAAAERSAGEKPEGDLFQSTSGAQAVYGLIELHARGADVISRRGDVLSRSDVTKR
jgi:hypothetical protein